LPLGLEKGLWAGQGESTNEGSAHQDRPQGIHWTLEEVDRLARAGDWILLLAGAGLMLWWAVRRFDHWLHEPPAVRLRKLAQAGPIEQSEAVELLQEHGYEVLSGKHRIPLAVRVDDGPAQSTRLYFDYLACKEDKYYLVKLERSRLPTEWTASGLRERLLVYALLFPDCEGIIVADPRDKLLRAVRFQVEDDEE
jgi:hypothetical protein